MNPEKLNLFKEQSQEEKEPVLPETESWREGLKNELKELRKKQYSAQKPEDWTKEERERLLFLQALEEKEEKAPLSSKEKEELRELEKSQTRSVDWTAERADRLMKLRRRDEANKKT